MNAWMDEFMAECMLGVLEDKRSLFCGNNFEILQLGLLSSTWSFILVF